MKLRAMPSLTLKIQALESWLLFPSAVLAGSAFGHSLNGDVDFAVSSRRLKNEETQKAKSKRFDLEAIPVAGDVIAIAVNRNLDISKVRGLTVQ